jgi:hypothetical protein
MEVSGQRHAPVALLLREEHPVPIVGCVGPRAGLDAVVMWEIPSPCRESNPRRPARSLVTNI